VIVYIFYNDYYKKVFLPQRVIGIYPVYLNETRVFINIEAVQNVWRVKPADNYVIMENGNEVEYPELKPYNTYVITNQSFYVYMVATPQYVLNENFLKLSSNSLSFGSAPSNDIVYKNGQIKDNEFVASKSELGYWTIEAKTKSVYLNDQLVQKSYLFAGDVIFCFGIKIIFFGIFFSFG
jgi:hypothetical protein